MDNQRNLIIAVLLCGLMLVGWDAAVRYFYPEANAPVVAASSEDTPTEVAAANMGGTGGELAADGAAITRQVDLATELAGSERVAIEAPRLTGSINPTGARIDDVTLTDFRQTTDEDSGPIQLFAPEGTPTQQFSRFGWLINGQLATDGDTPWQVEGGPLTAETPVTLRHSDDSGREYAIRISVDENYLFTVTQTIANNSQAGVIAQPYGLVARTSATATADIWNAHSGPISGSSEAVSYDLDYDDLAEDGEQVIADNPEWFGFTDIYWLAALVAENDAPAVATFRPLSQQLFRADLIYEPTTVAPGETFTRTTRLFAGAKESVVLDDYQDTGIGHFGKAIDWGWFEWFEKPMLWLLRQFNDLAGNFGVAIIMLTILIRILLFPIAQKQFASMAGMKAVQPKMKALQDRYKDDKPKLQQEMMALYKKEGVNPLAGCLPILIQIPIFFALYKVLILALEMRHEKFLWISDLSAPDPAKILNLFGLLPFDPPSFLGIGILAVLLGVTMWLTFKLNPSAMDPMQQQIFNLMPWVLMFVMAPFAAGLLLYWVTNNILTLAQQSYLYSKNPQLKAAAEAEKAEKARAAEREKAEKSKG